MLVNFNFFDNENWSVYATLQTFIVLIIYYFGFTYIKNRKCTKKKQKDKEKDKKYSHKLSLLSILTISSLIGMMSGNLLDKIIFSFFLSMAVFPKDIFVLGTFLTLTSTIITTIIPRNNQIYNYILQNTYLVNFTKICIFVWFIIFLFLLKKHI